MSLTCESASGRYCRCRARAALVLCTRFKRVVANELDLGRGSSHCFENGSGRLIRYYQKDFYIPLLLAYDEIQYGYIPQLSVSIFFIAYNRPIEAMVIRTYT